VDGGVLAGRFFAGSNSREWRLLEETSAVLRFKVFYIAGRANGQTCRDLVKRCDLAEINLIQLESLILAQSERWRQA
jgi:hypothetical protein